MRSLRLVLLIVLLLPTSLYAWGSDGHQLTCLIAEERLTPEAKAGIHELLGADVNISDAEIASYADTVRRQRRNTAPWHYVDVPVEAEKFEEQRDGNRGNNVIDKIDEMEKVVADRDKPKAERAEALKFLVHLVGDAHQPLHCADRDGDRGGNTRLTFILDRPRAVNLHMAWDSVILLSHKAGVRNLSYALALNQKITSELADKWSKGTAEDWVNESHGIAVKLVYADVPADGPPPKLGEWYVRMAAGVIDEQLQKGGVRLAMVLNRCFAE